MKGTLARLSSMLHGGVISSEELTKKYIEGIEKTNPEILAYVRTTFDTALGQAAEADRKIASGTAGPLCGIPFALKDNICTDGIETTCCSRILEGFRPYYDATVYSRLREAGCVLLGKTNMDEFAMGSTSETSCYGAPKNPRNTGKVTGGSSGGSAAAVCAGIAPFAIGSDTGGSIRQPAAFCGTVGFKPTYGAVSRYGLIAYASSFDQIGPLCSSVSDAAAVYDVIRGRDRRDMTSRDTPAAPTRLTGDVRGLRIGIADEFFRNLSPEIAGPIERTVREYERGGAEIVRVKMPLLDTALPVYYIIACAEASSNLGRYDGIRYGYRTKNYTDADDMVTKTRSEGFGKEVQRRIMLGTYVLSGGYHDAYYKKATHLRERIKAGFADVFAECDVLFAPVAPSVAFDRGYAAANTIDTYLSDLYTVPVNIASLPSVSLPCGEDGNGMPVGMQIIGDMFCDEKVLSCAYYMEREDIGAIGDVGGGVGI